MSLAFAASTSTSREHNDELSQIEWPSEKPKCNDIYVTSTDDFVCTLFIVGPMTFALRNLAVTKCQNNKHKKTVAGERAEEKKKKEKCEA